MTWLAWRQMRGQTIAAAVGLAALALLLTILIGRSGALSVRDVVPQLPLPQKRVFALGSAALMRLRGASAIAGTRPSTGNSVGNRHASRGRSSRASSRRRESHQSLSSSIR